MEFVNAVQPYVSRQVWAMVQMQLLTAARPGEIALMRPCDINREGKVWVYQPHSHKTAYRGYERKIYIGPRAQAVLMPFLLRDPKAYCFSPAEAEEERRQKLFEARTTRLSCGNTRGTNTANNSGRKISGRYTAGSYRIAIAHGCQWVHPLPSHLAQREDESAKEWRMRLTPEQKAEMRAWRKAHRWHPHQLRHNAATELRKEFGLEAARIILGHHSTAVTEIYAEKDEQQAVEAIMKVG